MTNNLKEIRTAAGLSQQQLAEASGVSLWAIQSYEQGKRPLAGASYAVVKSLANALNAKTEDVVGTNEKAGG